MMALNEIKFYATFDPSYASKPVKKIASLLSPKFRKEQEELNRPKKLSTKKILSKNDIKRRQTGKLVRR